MKKSMTAAMALGLLAAPVLGMGVAFAAEPAKVTNWTNDTKNQASDWGPNCTKIEDKSLFTADGYQFVLPAGITFSQVIVKAGAEQSPQVMYENTIFGEPPVSGQFVWADTNGDGLYNPGGEGGDKQISHVIWCGEEDHKTPPPPPPPHKETPKTTPAAKPVPTAVPAGEGTDTAGGALLPGLGLLAVVAAGGTYAAIRSRGQGA